MRETEQRLVTMANQIARNLALRGDVEAAEATADHIATFWDPRMKQTAFALLARPEAEFLPIARAALEALAAGAEPAPQAGATQFNCVDEAGHSDAG
jgi:formate dehydrogenase subunit delta